jgi:hypothetical protein
MAGSRGSPVRHSAPISRVEPADASEMELPNGSGSWVVGCHPTSRRPRRSRADQGQGDKVVRPVGRSTLSPSGEAGRSETARRGDPLYLDRKLATQARRRSNATAVRRKTAAPSAARARQVSMWVTVVRTAVRNVADAPTCHHLRRQRSLAPRRAVRSAAGNAKNRPPTPCAAPHATPSTPEFRHSEIGGMTSQATVTATTPTRPDPNAVQSHRSRMNVKVPCPSFTTGPQ